MGRRLLSDRKPRRDKAELVTPEREHAPAKTVEGDLTAWWVEDDERTRFDSLPRALEAAQRRADREAGK